MFTRYTEPVVCGPGLPANPVVAAGGRIPVDRAQRPE